MSQDNPLPADPILQTPLVIHTTSGVLSLDDPQVWQPSPLRGPCSAKLEENPPPQPSQVKRHKTPQLQGHQGKDNESPPLGLGHHTGRDHPQQPQQIGEKDLRCSNLHELLLQTEAPFYTRCTSPHAHHLQDKLGHCRRDDKQQPNTILQTQLLSIEESKGKQRGRK